MMEDNDRSTLLENPPTLMQFVHEQLGDLSPDELSGMDSDKLKRGSVVLFIISPREGPEGQLEPCLILNKRSARVRQAGDLCCPGGGLSLPLDRRLAHLVKIPGAPLHRWTPWPHWQKNHAESSRTLALLLAAGLREAWEEMRFNPFRFTFLGMLPTQRLVMFDREIYPMVGWAPHQSLKPNWEVERIISIPLRKLLDPSQYGRFRPMVATGDNGDVQKLHHNDFPGFIHEDDEGREMLWGATYRITQEFLARVFDFSPPEEDALPLVHRHLDESYLNGSRWRHGQRQRHSRSDW